MVDILSSEQRAKTMRAVKGEGTVPELLIRQLCREVGMPGYRLNRRDIPGKPDLAYVGRKLAIFVHGCFWHRHSCRAGRKVPIANADYWSRKLQRNLERDKATVEQLGRTGWAVLILWECQLKNREHVKQALRHFFAENSL